MFFFSALTGDHSDDHNKHQDTKHHSHLPKHASDHDIPHPIPKHVAGKSMMRGADHTENILSDPMIPHTWSPCDATSFHLRAGADYHTTKKKEPSAEAFYETIGVDLLKSPKKIDNIGSKVEFPEEWLTFETPGMKNDTVLPTILIVNAQIPSDFSPSLPFFDSNDGDGWSIVYYFKIKESTIAAMKHGHTCPPSLKLLAKYLTDGPVAFHKHGISSRNEWIGRFKIMARIENIDDFGLPSFITAYNAKPVLIRNTGHLLRGTNYVEMDINVHEFGNVPKQALQIMFNRFDQMIISVGMCVESREDDEMPETLFGSLTLNGPNHNEATNW